MRAGCYEVTAVMNNSQLEKFVHMPQIVYKQDPCWPGHDAQKELNQLCPEKNPGLKYMKIQPFIVQRDGSLVGRICGIIFDGFNQRWQKKVAFFGYFESISNQIIADLLLQAVKDWAIDQGMEEIWGPITCNIEGEVGMLVEGFGLPYTIGMAYNPEYYPKMCLTHGLIPERQLLELEGSIELFYKNACNSNKDITRLANNSNLKLRTINHDHVVEDLKALTLLYNQSFYDHWGFGEIQMDYFVALILDMYSLIPHELFLIIEDDGKPIAFSYCTTNQRKGVQPQERSQNTRIRFNTIGVHPDYRNQNIGRWINCEMIKRCWEAGYLEGSISWVDAKNETSLRITQSMGARIIKKFQVFSTELGVTEKY